MDQLDEGLSARLRSALCAELARRNVAVLPASSGSSVTMALCAQFPLADAESFLSTAVQCISEGFSHYASVNNLQTQLQDVDGEARWAITFQVASA